MSDRDSLHKTEQNNLVGKNRRRGSYHEFTPPDGGFWAWIVAITSFCANGTVHGIGNVFGILYVKLRDKYAGDDPSISFKTSWIGSVSVGLSFLMCMFASIASDRFGIRKTAFIGALLGLIGLVSSAFVEQLEILYLTYGIILGAGSAFAYSPSLVILGHYFKKRIGIVNGFVTFGSSAFTIALSLGLPYLLETVDLKYTFLFLGGLYALLLPCVLTWKPLIHHESKHPSFALSTESLYDRCGDCCSWTKKFLNVSIWRNRGYVIWVLSGAISLFGYFVPFFHLVRHTKDVFPQSDGSYLILCIGITSGVSRIISGKLADLACVNRVRMQQTALVTMGITTLCIPFAVNFYGLIAMCLVMGICDGLFICLVGPIAFDLVGPTGASQAIGFLLGIFSLPISIGPPVAGLLYDYLGDYKIAFHVAGVPPIVGAMFMFLIPARKQNFPAVIETQEFAAVSLRNILQDASDPAHKAMSNGGPAETELIIIKDGGQIEDELEDYVPEGNTENRPTYENNNINALGDHNDNKISEL